MVLAEMLKSSSRTFQGPHEGYSRRSTLTQNSTFIIISKQVHFTFDNLTLSSINEKLHSSEIATRSEAPVITMKITCSGTLSKIKFKHFQTKIKNFQGPCLFSRTFKALKIWKKNSKTFRDWHEPCITEVTELFDKCGQTGFHAAPSSVYENIANNTVTSLSI